MKVHGTREELEALIGEQPDHIAQLRAALKPFARMADNFDGYLGSDWRTKDTPFHFTIGEFRHARAALTKVPICVVCGKPAVGLCEAFAMTDSCDLYGEREIAALKAENAKLQELLRGTGANRYWESRWRDADKEGVRLRAENAKLQVDFAECLTANNAKEMRILEWQQIANRLQSALDRLEVLYREQSAENAKLQAENTELRQFVSRMAYEGAAIQDLAHKQLAALTNEQKPCTLNEETK